MRKLDACPGGKNASEGEQDANKKLLRQLREYAALGMYSCKVEQRSGCKKRVALARSSRHQVEDDPPGAQRRNNCRRNKNGAKALVEEMAITKYLRWHRKKTGTSVENAVCDVDWPNNQREQDGNPPGEVRAKGPGKCLAPDQRDRGSVKAGQMPEPNREWRLELITMLAGRKMRP